MGDKSKPNPAKERLLVALRKGQSEKVASLLDANQDPGDPLHADLEADTALNTILHRAARYGKVKVVQVIPNT